MLVGNISSNICLSGGLEGNCDGMVQNKKELQIVDKVITKGQVKEGSNWIVKEQVAGTGDETAIG